MQSDIFLVIGLVLGALAFPSLLNAYSQSRFPRLALLMFLGASVSVIIAFNTRPGGYTFSDIPEAFIRVIALVIG